MKAAGQHFLVPATNEEKEEDRYRYRDQDGGERGRGESGWRQKTAFGRLYVRPCVRSAGRAVLVVRGNPTCWSGGVIAAGSANPANWWLVADLRRRRCHRRGRLPHYWQHDERAVGLPRQSPRRCW